MVKYRTSRHDRIFSSNDHAMLSVAESTVDGAVKVQSKVFCDHPDGDEIRDGRRVSVARLQRPLANVKQKISRVLPSAIIMCHTELQPPRLPYQISLLARVAEGSSLKTLIFGLLIVSSICGVNSFNVDTDSRIVHTAPLASCDNDCMFGFSVAQHREKGRPWLLVGAPEAESGQPGVHRGGAVYKCVPDQPGKCDLIQFDASGNTLAPTGQQYDNKTGQWFGSLVRSSGEDGVVLACAPRYIYYVFMDRMDPVGMCYTARDDFNQIRAHRPCVESGKWGYHRQGSCQAGLGAAISESGDQMFIGAVGSWYWQGQVFSQKLFPLTRNSQQKTAEGSPEDDDSYLGYSVATGEFSGDNDNADVAVGMPRGAGLEGKVVLYNSNLTNLNNISGDQIGAYFGYSVAAGDLDGDGLDDIIVGAPMHTNYDVMGKFETGRVYVVFQGSKHEFEEFVTLDGENHKARFGLSVACAGNLNLDGRSETNRKGIQDLIVGAPYDGPDHRGAIYVYLGSKVRLTLGSWKYAQVIYGKDLDPGIRTFGWSLSAGMDLDGNEYPDVLVGAYDSGHAVFFRSAPVVHLDAKVEARIANKQVDLEQKRCTLRDGTRVACMEVDVSMKYHGVRVPDSIDLELQYVLDARKAKNQRLFFLDHEDQSSLNRSITVKKGREWKHSFTAYLPSTTTIRDKLNKLDIEVHYSMANRGRPPTGSRGQQQASLSSAAAAAADELRPVLGQEELKAKDSVSIQKDCGDDLNCIPDLKVSAQVVSGPFVFGSGDKMEIVARIDNRGEDAFNAMLYLQMPADEVNFINANTSGSGSVVSILCSPPTLANNFTLQCEIGNPLPANAQVDVRIFLQPTENNLDRYLQSYTFLLAVNSSNPERDYSSKQDNELVLVVPMEVTSDCRITGKSEPAQVEYNTTQVFPSVYVVEDQIGEEIIHIYDLKNKGPSMLQEAEVFILWPSFTGYEENGKKQDLLYLLGVDYDQSKVTCQSISNINPRYLKTFGSKGYAEAVARAELEFPFSNLYKSSSRTTSSGYQTTHTTGISSSSTGGTRYFSSSSSSSSSGSSAGASSGGSSSSSSSYSSSSSSYSSSSSSSGSTSGYTGGHNQGSRYQGGSASSSYGGSVSGSQGSSSSSSSAGASGRSRSGPLASASGNRDGGGSFEDDGEMEESAGLREGVVAEGRTTTFRLASGATETKLTKSPSRSSSSSAHLPASTAAAAGSGASSSSYQGGGGSSRIIQETMMRRQDDSYSHHDDGGASSLSSRSSSSYQQQGGVVVPSSSSSSRGSIMHSGWKLLDNGTYIRVYDSKTTANTDDDGNNNNDLDQDFFNRGRSSSMVGGGGGGGQRGGAAYTTDTILKAAKGPGNYHGTMSKAELEQEAGGPIFYSTNQETVHQVETTRYSGGNRGASGRSGGGSATVGAEYRPSTLGSTTTTYEEGSYYDQGNRGRYAGGGGDRGGSSRSGSSSWRDDGSVAASSSGYKTQSNASPSTSAQQGESTFMGSSSGSSFAQGGSTTTYEEGSYYDQGNRGRYAGGGGDRGGSSRSGSSSWRDDGSVAASSSGYKTQSNASPSTLAQQGESTFMGSSSGSSFAQGGSTTTYEEGSYYDQGNRGRYSGGSEKSTANLAGSSEPPSSGASSAAAIPTGKWVWSETTKKWEWEESGSAAAQGTSAGSRGFQSGGSSDQQGSGGYPSTSSYFGGSNGNGNALSSDDQEDHHLQQQQSGGSSRRRQDTGWVLQNGTYVRRQSAWSSSSSTTTVGRGGGDGRVRLSDDDDLSEAAMRQHYGRGSRVWDNVGQQGRGETGDQGRNSTDWVEQPDGTHVRRITSWASWSKTSNTDDDDGDDDFDPEYIQQVKADLEAKARTSLENERRASAAGFRRPPSNVEPGFEEDYYHRRHPEVAAQLQDRGKRKKRSAAVDFDKEVYCDPDKCTLISCMVGPLAKDEVITFRIRSRLATETQVKNWAGTRVEISSKMITRVTSLPFQADPRAISPQVFSVTTEVFPSDLGEAPIPWWVWLLAALGGLLLLALIVYCLYRCGFFKRKRPENHPEREPLNGNGYH